MSFSLRASTGKPAWRMCSIQALQQPQYGSLCTTTSGSAASVEADASADAAAAGAEASGATASGAGACEQPSSATASRAARVEVIVFILSEPEADARDHAGVVVGIAIGSPQVRGVAE